MRSWALSDALAGSPLPPSERHVDRENCHLPRYVPPREIARGLPTDSHWAISRMMRGRRTLDPLERDLWLTSLDLKALRWSLRRVLGPTTPSDSRPLRRWKRLTDLWA